MFTKLLDLCQSLSVQPVISYHFLLPSIYRIMNVKILSM
jgi:hypothetical protein